MANIGTKENLTVEFKSDVSRLPDGDIIDAVVAFANTDGGDLYLGVEDNGDITGLHKDHMDTTRLSAFIANKTVPPVPVRAEVLDLERPVLKISVPKRTSIVSSSSGKIQRRRLKADGTPENVPMYPYEIASRLSSLSLLDYSAQPVPDASYADLDPVERERLRNIIRSYRGETALLELDDEDLDKSLQFVTKQDDKLVPTFCGLLMIGRVDSLKHHMPTAEASIQVLEGTDIRVNESFILPILESFDKITGRFSAWNGSEEMEMGLFRVTIPDYDPRAFREALVNAFCHRDYSMLGRVRIQINDEGMSITNPGGFIEGINANNLLDAEPHGRNVVLADAMKRIGLAERTGRGIDRIYEGSLLNGRLLPDYSKSTANRVELFIPKGPTDKAFIQLVSTEQKRLGRPLPIYSLLVLNALKNLSRASVHDIAEYLKIDESRARVNLETLADSGIIEAGGNGRGRYYMLGADYYRGIDKSSEYVRRKDIDALRHSELVLQLASQQSTITRKDVIDLLHVTPPQAYRLLQKLVKQGKLSLIGRGAGAKYAPK
ncbi:MAG: putative DNA binding domain-containing protein [Clostridiales bacterium]|nr:putative DNA binding domain-containing protein [Clostridiales bacterium]